MATKRYTVDEALEAVFDDDFGLSDGGSSNEEEGEDYYAYLGEPVVPASAVEALTRDVVSGDEDDDDRDDASDDCAPEIDPSTASLDEEDPLGEAGTHSDYSAPSMSEMHGSSESDGGDESFPGTARASGHSSDESGMSTGEGGD